MKKINLLIFTILLSFLSSNAFAREEILVHHSNIKVNEDASIEVFESIAVNVENYNINLGIYRDYNTTYKMDGKEYKTPIEIIAVYRNGNPENFWVENHSGKIRLQIGAEQNRPENVLEKGIHKYIIYWKARGHIRYFENYDEIYINSTGNGWSFPIEKASAAITLPEGAYVEQFSSYYGKFGSTEKAQSIQENNEKVLFEAPRSLSKSEGLTVAVGFTKGIISVEQIPAVDLKILTFIMKLNSHISAHSAVVILVTLITLLFYLLVWLKYGKDHKTGLITPLFSAPKDLSPAKASVIWSGKIYNKDKAFLASIISLASKGYIKFNDKKIIKQERNFPPDFAEERKIYNEMFSKNKDITLGKYNDSMKKANGKLTNFLSETKKKYIKENNRFIFYGIIFNIAAFFFIPFGKQTMFGFGAIALLTLFYSPFFAVAISLLRSKAFGTGILISCFIVPHYLIFLTFIPAAIISGGGEIQFSLKYFIFLGLAASSVLVHFTFYYLMDKPSVEATKILTDLKGLKMFMDMVEKDRYKKITPSIFEQNLPFAIVFGIENVWFEKLKELYPTYNPEWYDSKNNFNYGSIRSISNSLHSTSTLPPSKSSGYSSGGWSSSGSSGGGSSGGGSGGGGGGGR